MRMTCGTSKPDVADGAADGNGQAGKHRCGDVHDQLHAGDVHAEMHGLALAGEQDVQVGGGGQNRAGRGKEAAHQDPQQAVRQRNGEIAHQPEGDSAEIAAGERGHQEHDVAERNDAVMMPAK